MLKVIKCRDLLFIISRKEGAQPQEHPSPQPPPVEKSRRPYLPEAPLLDDSDHAFLDEFGALPEDEAALARFIVECKRREQEYLKQNQDKLQRLKQLWPGMSQEALEEMLLALEFMP
ncbi:MAG: hypothetical protein H5T42_07495 [Methanothrix sp.]|nr:hypothetical protein [Methanothrix sp.]